MCEITTPRKNPNFKLNAILKKETVIQEEENPLAPILNLQHSARQHRSHYSKNSVNLKLKITNLDLNGVETRLGEGSLRGMTPIRAAKRQIFSP